MVKIIKMKKNDFNFFPYFIYMGENGKNDFGLRF